MQNRYDARQRQAIVDDIEYVYIPVLPVFSASDMA
jgi:hypothetical protein